MTQTIKTAEATRLLKQIGTEIVYTNGTAKTDKYPTLRHVDAKVRDVKMVLSSLPGKASELAAQMEADEDFAVHVVHPWHHVKTKVHRGFSCRLPWKAPLIFRMK
jgi:hypothetical protein